MNAPAPSAPVNLFTGDRDAVRPMSREETKVYVALCFADMGSGADEPLAGEALAQTFRPRGFTGDAIIALRLAVMRPDLSFHPRMIELLGFFSRSPGVAVLWAWSLAHETARRGAPVPAKDFGELCPWGPPTDEFLTRAWDAQKSGGGNLLDARDAYA